MYYLFLTFSFLFLMKMLKIPKLCLFHVLLIKYTQSNQQTNKSALLFFLMMQTFPLIQCLRRFPFLLPPCECQPRPCAPCFVCDFLTLRWWKQVRCRGLGDFLVAAAQTSLEGTATRDYGNRDVTSARSLAASLNGPTRHTIHPNGSGAGSAQASLSKLNNFSSTSVGFKPSRTVRQREEDKRGEFFLRPHVCSSSPCLDEEERAKTTVWRGLALEAGAVGSVAVGMWKGPTGG